MCTVLVLSFNINCILCMFLIGLISLLDSYSVCITVFFGILLTLIVLHLDLGLRHYKAIGHMAMSHEPWAMSHKAALCNNP